MFGGYDGERDGGFGKSLCDRARLKNCLGEQWDQPIPAALGSNLQLNYAPFVVSVEEKTGARISGGEMPADSPASLSEGVARIFSNSIRLAPRIATAISAHHGPTVITAMLFNMAMLFNTAMIIHAWPDCQRWLPLRPRQT